ncbi:MAG: energy transducer TonB [Flavobacteriales bacterium]
MKVDTTQIDTIYSFAEVMPQYPGGDPAMMDFIRKNIVFPESVHDREVFGATTYVEYVVEKDGQVSNVKPLKNPNSDIAKQLVRIVKTFPKYSPGKIDRKPVRVRMMVPLRINLQ